MTKDDTPEDRRQARWDAMLRAQRALATRFGVLEPDRPAAPVAGDVLSLGDQARVPGVWWAVLEPHPRDPCLWAAVPADDHPLVGGTDVSVQTALGRLTLRCGLSLWVHRRDVPAKGRVAWLDGWDLDRAGERLHDVHHGRVTPTLSALEADADPDLGRWMTRLVSLRQAVQDEVSALTPAEQRIHALADRLRRLLGADRLARVLDDDQASGSGPAPDFSLAQRSMSLHERVESVATQHALVDLVASVLKGDDGPSVNTRSDHAPAPLPALRPATATALRDAVDHAEAAQLAFLVELGRTTVRIHLDLEPSLVHAAVRAERDGEPARGVKVRISTDDDRVRGVTTVDGRLLLEVAPPEPEGDLKFTVRADGETWAVSLR